ncbi:helix-turn-helix transcriptional regulator [bacterium]|nr:helix-turn-helix transcriptional regulator [bacterium]
MLRTAEDLSQEKLATEVGISRAYLSQVETGSKDPGLHVIRKIAEFFKIPLPILLAGETGQTDETNAAMYVQLNKMLGDILLVKMMSSKRKKKKRKSKKK